VLFAIGVVQMLASSENLDRLRAASNQAVEKVRALIAEETAKMAANIGLPPGMNLPLPGMS